MSSRLADLQKSGEESKTSKARETDLGGGASGRRGDGGRSLDRGSRLRGDGDGGSRDRGGDGRDGGIVGRNNGGDGRAPVGLDAAGGDDGLGHGAGAVGDGDGGGLSNSDGAGAVGNGGGRGAVGDEGLDNLSDNGDVARVGHGARGGGKDGDSRVLHFDGIKVTRRVGIRLLIVGWGL